ncbi:hypothetical protein [Thermomonas aquatica]|jgi:hypothetical protein|uniref:Uncharacterized protein n=1 Tax=Thermomonas aquatica TaxID=2202149 RepID=A0A5B7ZR17_9GAMM|nr:hypothetical protein [Thermomonas aquatica]QDA57075.1 hypothetical protein FHQ07_06965 [Thermomonas aquatica]
MLREYFDDRVLGHQRLSRVFWLEGVLASQLLFLALLAAFQYGNATVLVLAVAAFIAYTAWIMRRIWLNAFNVSRAELGTMARVLTIGWTINAVTVCVFLVLAKLGGQPLQFLQ